MRGDNVSILVTITDDQTKNLSNNAQSILQKQVELYVDVILREARNIEEGDREGDAKEEITSAHINKAVRKCRNYIVKKPTKLQIANRFVVIISGLLAGGLFDANGFQNNTSRFVLFIVFFAILCITTAIQFAKE
jgi:hypothetical protein